jgi:hypothetical protein
MGVEMKSKQSAFDRATEIPVHDEQEAPRMGRVTKPKILRVWLAIRADTQSCPQPDDTECLRAWQTGLLSYYGVQAKVQVLSRGRRITLASEGRWGVRSNLGRAMAEIEREECSQLRDALASLGFGRRAIEYAFRKITVEKKT